MYLYSIFRYIILGLIISQVSMSPLDDLKASHTTAKSRVTRFGNQLSRLIAEGESTVSFDELVIKLKQAS